MVRSRQVSRAHQEFVDDFTSGEAEGFLEQQSPFRPRFRVVAVEPVFEGAGFFLQLQDGFCVFNGRRHFQAVADNTRIGQQAVHVFFLIGSYFADLKIVIRFTEGLLLFQDGGPAESGLIDLQNQAAEQFIIIVYRKSIQFVVVRLMKGLVLGFHAGDGGAVGWGGLHWGKDRRKKREDSRQKKVYIEELEII